MNKKVYMLALAVFALVGILWAAGSVTEFGDMITPRVIIRQNFTASGEGVTVNLKNTYSHWALYTQNNGVAAAAQTVTVQTAHVPAGSATPTWNNGYSVQGTSDGNTLNASYTPAEMVKVHVILTPGSTPTPGATPGPTPESLDVTIIGTN